MVWLVYEGTSMSWLKYTLTLWPSRIVMVGGIWMNLSRMVVAVPETEPADVVRDRCGAIHIELPGEIRISLEGKVDPAMVRAVLQSLRG